MATYSAPGDWVLDPFCGFGTALAAAQRLDRFAVGFETDAERAAFAARGLRPPSRVVNDRAERIDAYDLPPFDLVLTSPPYTSFRTFDEEGAAHYLDDLGAIFGRVKGRLRAGATVVMEMSNVREGGGVRTVAWDAARTLAGLFAFQGEVVRCNTGPEPAGPGYDHSYLLVFRNA